MNYEKALEKARAAYGTGAYDDATLEFIFPQIKESEDEKIRKGLIHHLKELREWKAGSMSPIKVKEHYDAWIAYLEKQKEQKPAELEQLAKLREMTHEIREAYERGIEVGRAESKKEWSEEDKRAIDRACVALRAYSNGDLPEFLPSELFGYADRLQSLRPQPKQEWSKEDEENFKWFDKFFRAESVIAGGRDIPQDKYSWFKSLRPKQKVEWSEKDELQLKAAIEICERSGHTITADWLKSLRPSWKPSEEEERLINTSISFLKDFADKGYENAVECIGWLKSKLNGNSGK